jgi:hypothetical protein
MDTWVVTHFFQNKKYPKMRDSKIEIAPSEEEAWKLAGKIISELVAAEKNKQHDNQETWDALFESLNENCCGDAVDLFNVLSNESLDVYKNEDWFGYDESYFRMKRHEKSNMDNIWIVAYFYGDDYGNQIEIAPSEEEAWKFAKIIISESVEIERDSEHDNQEKWDDLFNALDENKYEDAVDFFNILLGNDERIEVYEYTGYFARKNK